MSTEVVAPAPVATISEPAPIAESAEAPIAPIGEEQPAAASSAPAADNKVESSESHPASPEQHKKRSPFGDLKNKLFHHKSTSPTREKEHEHADAPEETAKENALVVKDETVAPVFTAEETAAAAEAGASGTPAAPVDEEAHKKPKSPGVFDKVKSFFGENKKDKKVKTPTEEKAEPLATGETAAYQGETFAAPTTEAAGAVTAPEAVAAAEATASATAPVPQVIEPIPAPINEPATVSEAPATVETETAPPAAEVDAKKEGEELKFDEQAKTDDKAPKRDLAKLSRRLSAKVGAFLHSPKKEKKEKDVVPTVEGAEAPAASEAPKIETTVDESKLDAAGAAPGVQAETETASAAPVAAAETAEATAAIVEAAPVETAETDATKAEAPAAAPVVAATA